LHQQWPVWTQQLSEKGNCLYELIFALHSALSAYTPSEMISRQHQMIRTSAELLTLVIVSITWFVVSNNLSSGNCLQYLFVQYAIQFTMLILMLLQNCRVFEKSVPPWPYARRWSSAAQTLGFLRSYEVCLSVQKLDHYKKRLEPEYATWRNPR
jgi:hypothetical protein